MAVVRVLTSLVTIILKVIASVIVQLIALLASSLVVLAVVVGLLVLAGYGIAALFALYRRKRWSGVILGQAFGHLGLPVYVNNP